MAQYATELFAHFVYSPDLSYHDLLEREEELKNFVSRLLEKHNGDFLHFEAVGDALRAQCVFTDYNEEDFQSLCDALAPAMDGLVEGILLFVSKELNILHLYSVHDQKWQETAIDLPVGPIGLKLQRMEENAESID